MSGEKVAYFEIRTADCDGYGELERDVLHGELMRPGTHCNIEICSNEQFYLGRDPYWYRLCRV
jgi:hypothetical protein